ncbi:MAG: transporter substrate-binding protein [Symbiobacteriaceae bacterium]|jgi:multiple sugar transport system substrate-binding protein|nr:transporter substrate-binding protein [Symbiobacteriaceae bacterium]
MKRTFPIVLALVMLLAAACQKGAPVRAAQPPAQPDAPPAIITIDLGYHSTDAFRPLIDQLIAAFEKRFPEYRINKVELPPRGPGQQAEIDKGLRSGAYDIIRGAFDRQLLEPLDPYLTRSMPALTRVAESSEHLRISGRLYGLPLWRVPEGFIINRELWAAGGLPLPESGWSWDDLRTAVARLTHGDGENRVWGLNTALHEFLFSTWLMQKAGPKFWLAAEQDLREGLRFFMGLAGTDQSMPRPPQRDWGTGLVSMSERDLFRDKRAVIEYGGVHQILLMNERYPFAWDILPMPARSGGRPVLRVRTVSYAMAASSDQKDAAWEFLRFAVGPEGAAIIAASGALPTDGAGVTEEVWAAMQPAPPAGMTHLLDTPWVSDGVYEGNASRLVNELFRLTNLCLRGELDPDTAVTQYLEFRKRYVVE